MTSQLRTEAVHNCYTIDYHTIILCVHNHSVCLACICTSLLVDMARAFGVAGHVLQSTTQTATATINETLSVRVNYMPGTRCVAL